MSQPAPSQIKVLIVEDDATTLRALSLAVQSSPQLTLAGALDSVAAALAWFETNQADILLTDLGMPDGSGVDVIHACVQHCPDCDIMVITMSSDEDSVLTCIEAGASGYVLKDAGRLDVVRALLELHAGGSPISPIIARKILARMRPAKADVAVEPEIVLTKREAVILDLIARGDSYGDVAKFLSLSVSTVQTHIKSIYDKLSVHSRGEAVYEAQRRGLLKFGDFKDKK